jgi:hypothetical protein
MPTEIFVFKFIALFWIPYLLIIIVGFRVAGQRFGSAGIYGWSTLVFLLLLIAASSTDTGSKFEVMAPLIISCVAFGLATLLNLKYRI